MFKFLGLINAKLEDQEVKGINDFYLRIFGSFLITLSGSILFADKVASHFNFNLVNNFGYHDTETLIWVLSQTLSPLIILIASLFNPFKIAYLITIYTYTVQLYWVFQPNVTFDNFYLQVYAFGACTSFLLLSYMIIKINSIKLSNEKENELFKNEVNETINLLKEKIIAQSNR
ncbi:hypothetical protein [Aquimarina algiphila]|uniref:hypothetical protein n=1 Tax=Aquimarina algiphila TaxID=2047982 RepID=UPI00232C39C8|nr:hypothetical protein [Aquimarina algiphila]